MPKGPRKFEFIFERKGLTRFGGLSLFQQFCKSLRLRYFLQHSVRWPTYDHRAYHPADLFLAHITMIVAGLGRIENAQSLIHNGFIPPILGLADFPHRDTLRTFLWRFNVTALRSLEHTHDRFRNDAFKRLGLLYSATIDADTTALMVYGQQEGADLGYIPKRRHKKSSYTPILSSEGHHGLSLGMELRSGSVHGSTGAWLFLKQILDKLPSTIASSRTRVRLDGGFYDKDIIQKLDENRLAYVIVAKMTKPMVRHMVSARYHEFSEGWEAAEFTYTPFKWNERHHFVAIRRPRSFEPEEAQKRLLTLKGHTYHRALATARLDLEPPAVYRFYCDRAFQELLIREFKDGFFMAKIPSRHFWANAAYMEMMLWAYDLVLLFQALCLPKEFKNANISTLRRDLWWLPAEWVRHGNRNILWLPARYPQQDLFRKAYAAAGRAKPLI